MKIRFSIISPDLLVEVRAGVEMLVQAVNVGDMDKMDNATTNLLSLTSACHSIELTEKEWRFFLDEIRSKNPAFQSGYLLPGEFFSSIFPAAAAGDYVLELPVDGGEDGEESDV